MDLGCIDASYMSFALRLMDLILLRLIDLILWILMMVVILCLMFILYLGYFFFEQKYLGYLNGEDTLNHSLSENGYLR